MDIEILSQSEPRFNNKNNIPPIRALNTTKRRLDELDQVKKILKEREDTIHK